MARMRSPYYGSPDLNAPISNLARAIIGSAQDDADLARARASDALVRKYDAEVGYENERRNTERRKNNEATEVRESIRTLANDPLVQRSLLNSLGLVEGKDFRYMEGVGPVTGPEGQSQAYGPAYEAAFSYLTRGGNVDEMARGGRTIAGQRMVTAPGATEDQMRVGGALLGLEPDKGTAYTTGRADTILEGDRAVQRRNQDLQSADRKRGQDLADTRARDGVGSGNKPAVVGKQQVQTVEEQLSAIEVGMGVRIEPSLRTQILKDATTEYQKTKNLLTATTNAYKRATEDPDVIVERSTLFGMNVGKGTLKRRDAPAADATAPAAAPTPASKPGAELKSLPAGAKLIGTSGGKRVYEVDGKRYIEN